MGMTKAEAEKIGKVVSLATIKGFLTKLKNEGNARVAGAEYGDEFYVEFVKRTDGEYRRMKCQYGVTKHLAGGVKSFDDKDHELKTVFDTEKQGYRSIPLEGVTKLVIDKVNVYIAEENLADLLPGGAH